MSSSKYPRTYHLPWSQGATNDDKIMKDLSVLVNNHIIITEKMDGSNTSLEYEGCFARTHSGPPTHASFDGLKALHASIKFRIPTEFQIFGEWLTALHSIHYTSLPAYFLLFNIRDSSKNEWLSWEEVKMWGEELGLTTVPTLFEGIVSSTDELQELTESLMLGESNHGSPSKEGMVVRVSSAFDNDDFPTHVGKMVRANHVTTSAHWKEQKIVKNLLKNS